MTAANGQNMEVWGSCCLPIGIGTKEYQEKFKIVEELKNDIIIGNDLMKKWGVSINFSTKEVLLDDNNRIPMRIYKLTRKIKVNLIKTCQISPRSMCKVPIRIEGMNSGEKGIVKTPLNYRWKN